jgi:glutamine synthetase
MRLGAYAANHEYGRAQYEINLRHSDALDAADRAFLFKDAVKEMAAMEGLLATFVGKPWNDDEGSGFHLHISLSDESGTNLLNGDGPEGLSSVAHHAVAGLLEARPVVDGVHEPDDERLPPHPRGGTGSHPCQLGHDNRLCELRMPRERASRDSDRDARRRRSRQPLPRLRAALFAALDGSSESSIRRRRSAGLSTKIPTPRTALHCRVRLRPRWKR